MCGFAGVVVWDDRYRVSQQTLRQMSARIAHRGPDGEGIHLNHESEINPSRPQVGLVHRRLAILDLDPRSNQPFTDNQGRWVVFNGEIYNFRQLRAELEKLKPDYQWRTTGDTEVLLVAYDVWDYFCVHHLEGMFAFAIWDERKQKLTVVRDRMGQKPLYVAFLGSEGTAHPSCSSNKLISHGMPRAVAFASELAALSPLKWVSRDVDPVAVMEYLRWGYIPNPLTVYAGVTQIEQGTAYSFSQSLESPDASSYMGYFKPGIPFGEPRLSDATAITRTREFVERAVARQLVSDVPVGCFLSGGIDSSIVAFAMKKAAGAGQRLHTFSIGFADPRYDETEFSAAIAAHLGTEHHSFVVKPDAAADLPKLAEVFGEPFGDSSALPTHYLARETRRHVKVALSGDGGDELFGGYDRYRAMLLGQRARTLLTPLPWIVMAPLFKALGGGHPKSRSARAFRFLQSLSLNPSCRYPSYLRLFDDRILRRLYLRPEYLAAQTVNTLYAGKELYGILSSPFSASVPKALAYDRLSYLPGDLLTKVDRASMLHALEVRSPFMDHELVDFAAGLTTSQLLKHGPKRMLREAFANDLPPWVFKRKKMGFAVPIGEWFRGELRSMLHDNLFASDSFATSHFNMTVVRRLVDEHEREQVDHSQRLYALLMLELWWREARG